MIKHNVDENGKLIMTITERFMAASTTLTHAVLTKDKEASILVADKNGSEPPLKSVESLPPDETERRIYFYISNLN